MPDFLGPILDPSSVPSLPDDHFGFTTYEVTSLAKFQPVERAFAAQTFEVAGLVLDTLSSMDIRGR